jgi:hypothetical protein
MLEGLSGIRGGAVFGVNDAWNMWPTRCECVCVSEVLAKQIIVLMQGSYVLRRMYNIREEALERSVAVSRSVLSLLKDIVNMLLA